MAVIDDLNSQCFHHGTKADLKSRYRFAPGYKPDYGRRKRAACVYLTAILDAATRVAGFRMAVQQCKRPKNTPRFSVGWVCRAPATNKASSRGSKIPQGNLIGLHPMHGSASQPETVLWYTY